MYARYWKPRYWPTWVLLAFMRACANLPYAWLLRLGKLLGFGFYCSSADRRHIAATNIALCFPELSPQKQKAIQKSCFQNIGISVMETALAWWVPANKIKTLYKIEGYKHIEQAQQSGKPILLLSGHMSCTEIGARMLALHLPFQAMYKPAKNKLFEAMMLQCRSRFYYEMVPRKQSRRLLRNMKQGIPTWYGPDQNFGHDDIVFAPFFGIPATTLTATARIAQSTRATVIPFFPYRLPKQRGYRLIIGKPLENFPSGDTLRDATHINRIIEEAVKLAPDQYLWAHKRFRVRPPGEQEIY